MVTLLSVLLPAGLQVYAQDSPVRSLMESSPAYASPVETESQAVAREMEDQHSAEIESMADVGALPEQMPYAWWEGMGALTLSTADTPVYDYSFRVMTGWEHNDNYYQEGDEKIDTNIFYVYPEASFAYDGSGLSVKVRYNPEIRWFDSSRLNDGINHQASFASTYKGSKAAIGASFFYQELEETVNLEVGSPISGNIMRGQLSASYDIIEKTQIGGVLSWIDSDYDRALSYERWIGDVYADYKLTEKTRIGLGGAYEFLTFDEGSDTEATRIFGRLSWQSSFKLGLRGRLGAEWRDYGGGGSDSEIVYAVGAHYAITESTVMSLDIYRNFNPSLTDSEQNYYSTGIAISFQQQIYRFTGLLTAGYEKAQYQFVGDRAAEVGADDSDGDLWFISPRIVIPLFKGADFSIYYAYRDSQGRGSHLESNIIGVSFSYGF